MCSRTHFSVYRWSNQQPWSTYIYLLLSHPCSSHTNQSVMVYKLGHHCFSFYEKCWGGGARKAVSQRQIWFLPSSGFSTQNAPGTHFGIQTRPREANKSPGERRILKNNLFLGLENDLFLGHSTAPIKHLWFERVYDVWMTSQVIPSRNHPASLCIPNCDKTFITFQRRLLLLASSRCLKCLSGLNCVVPLHFSYWI